MPNLRGGLANNMLFYEKIPRFFGYVSSEWVLALEEPFTQTNIQLYVVECKSGKPEEVCPM